MTEPDVTSHIILQNPLSGKFFTILVSVLFSAFIRNKLHINMHSIDKQNKN